MRCVGRPASAGRHTVRFAVRRLVCGSRAVDRWRAASYFSTCCRRGAWWVGGGRSTQCYAVYTGCYAGRYTGW